MSCECNKKRLASQYADPAGITAGPIVAPPVNADGSPVFACPVITDEQVEAASTMDLVHWHAMGCLNPEHVKIAKSRVRRVALGAVGVVLVLAAIAAYFKWGR